LQAPIKVVMLRCGKTCRASSRGLEANGLSVKPPGEHRAFAHTGPLLIRVPLFELPNVEYN
jgi:hypothetical protein